MVGWTADPPANYITTIRLEMATATILVWFKNDLRILDNPALYHALNLANSTASSPKPNVLALMILSPAEDKRHDRSSNQVDFLLRNLKILSSKLWDSFRVPLLVKNASSADNVHEIFSDIVTKNNVKHVFFNNQYEVDEAARDDKVEKLLLKNKVDVYRYHDQVIVPPGTLRAKSSGNVYTIYTPFRKSWAEYVKSNKHLLHIFENPSFQNDVSKLKEELNIENADAVPDSLAGFELSANKKKLMSELYIPGEDEAHKRLEAYAADKIKSYKADRDFPSIKGTSMLSPYLAIGVLSARQCIVKAIDANHGKIDSGQEGAVIWIQELVWREFYKNILVAYPRVCKNKPFKLDTQKVKWLYDEVKFKAWCEGKTGYPIVDAAMRQLNETGWMHNRARMIVASFLTKHLLHDWRLGEKYFSQNLIDCDFASNNGGWQWAASTGTDSQPYFRVFNPTRQSERFDSKGLYIKRWVPELKVIRNSSDIHDPSASLGPKKVLEIGYYKRVVEHEMARKRAIDAFKTSSTDEGSEGPERKKLKQK